MPSSQLLFVITTVCWKIDFQRHTASRVSVDTTYLQLTSLLALILLFLLKYPAILVRRKTFTLGNNKLATRLLLNTNITNNHHTQRLSLSILLMDLRRNHSPANTPLNMFRDPIVGRTGHFRHLKTSTSSSSHKTPNHRRRQSLATPTPLTISHLSSHNRPLSGHLPRERHPTLRSPRILAYNRHRNTLEDRCLFPRSLRQARLRLSQHRHPSNLFSPPNCSTPNLSSLRWASKRLPRSSKHTGSLLCHNSISSHPQHRRIGRMVVTRKIHSPRCHSRNLRNSLPKRRP